MSFSKEFQYGYGRRTQTNVLAGKKIRVKDDGTDVFEDYFTDSDSSYSTNNRTLGRIEETVNEAETTVSISCKKDRVSRHQKPPNVPAANTRGDSRPGSRKKKDSQYSTPEYSTDEDEGMPPTEHKAIQTSVVRKLTFVTESEGVDSEKDQGRFSSVRRSPRKKVNSIVDYDEDQGQNNQSIGPKCSTMIDKGQERSDAENDFDQILSAKDKKLQTKKASRSAMLDTQSAANDNDNFEQLTNEKFSTPQKKRRESPRKPAKVSADEDSALNEENKTLASGQKRKGSRTAVDDKQSGIESDLRKDRSPHGTQTLTKKKKKGKKIIHYDEDQGQNHQSIGPKYSAVNCESQEFSDAENDFNQVLSVKGKKSRTEKASGQKRKASGNVVLDTQSPANDNDDFEQPINEQISSPQKKLRGSPKKQTKKSNDEDLALSNYNKTLTSGQKRKVVDDKQSITDENDHFEQTISDQVPILQKKKKKQARELRDGHSALKNDVKTSESSQVSGTGELDKQSVSNENDNFEQPITDKMSTPQKKKRGRKKKQAKKTDEDSAPDNDTNTSEFAGPRRSTRNRMNPLAYWECERVSYKILKSGGIGETKVLKRAGEESNEKPKKHSTTNMTDKKKQIKILTDKKKILTDKKKILTDRKVHSTPHIEPSSETLIRDPKTGNWEKVLLSCVFSNLQWVTPNVSKTPSSVNDGKHSYSITKVFSSKELSFGYLKFPAHGEKETQVSPSDNIYFNVVSGRVEVTIQKSTRAMEVNDCFIVPYGIQYSLRNIGKREACLNFTTFKGPIFDYQAQQDDAD